MREGLKAASGPRKPNAGRIGLLAIVFFVFAVGYYLSYLFRTVNALLANRLMAEFSLDAAALGFLTSAYFLAAALAQLPIGVALDRFGSRRLQTVAMAVAATGAVVFAWADRFEALWVGRA